MQLDCTVETLHRRCFYLSKRRQMQPTNGSQTSAAGCFYLSKRRQMQLKAIVGGDTRRLFLPFKKKADATLK